MALGRMTLPRGREQSAALLSALHVCVCVLTGGTWTQGRSLVGRPFCRIVANAECFRPGVVLKSRAAHPMADIHFCGVS